MTENTHALLNYKWGKRLPIIMQTEVAECGLACLAMVANYHGHEIDLNSLRAVHAASGRGLTLTDLIQIADDLALNSRPLRVDINNLNKLSKPTILHWDEKHFVVLKNIKRNKFIIHDPAAGLKVMSQEQFMQHYSGVALELMPSPDFEPKKETNKAKLKDFWSRIKGVKRVLIQILALSLLIQTFTLISPFYLQLVIDEVVVSQDMDLLKLLALGFCLMMLVSVSITALRGLVILYMGSQLNVQIASNLFRHLIKLPMSYFEKRHIGDVISRFGSLQQVKDILTTGLVEAVVDALMVIGLLVMIFFYSPQLAMIVVFAISTYTISRVLLYKTNKRMTEEVITTHASQNTNFIETVRAIQAVKLFGNESQRQVIWQNHYADNVNAMIKVGKLSVGYNFLNGLLFGIENILIVYLAASAVVAGSFTVGMLFAFMTYKRQLVQRSSALIEKAIQFKMLSLHMERLGDIVLTEKEKNTQGQIGVSNIVGELKLSQVSFRYSDHSAKLFDNTELHIKQGESVVIVGPSGWGKTTLIKIMLGLLEPNQGSIEVGGYDIRKIGLKTYRKMIATVMQSDQLLSGSILENITFFDTNVDFDKVKEYAKMAAIHDDIDNMPLGYHTPIGDMGNSLSGGQIQRILLARALYKEPKIIFLDEATSSLDVALEKQVNETIKKLNITRVMVAHRPDTIAMADRIVTIEGSKLIELNSVNNKIASI